MNPETVVQTEEVTKEQESEVKTGTKELSDEEQSSTPGEKSEEEPKKFDKSKHQVPLTALLEERERRKEAELRSKILEERMASAERSHNESSNKTESVSLEGFLSEFAEKTQIDKSVLRDLNEMNIRVVSPVVAELQEDNATLKSEINKMRLKNKFPDFENYEDEIDKEISKLPPRLRKDIKVLEDVYYKQKGKEKVNSEISKKRVVSTSGVTAPFIDTSSQKEKVSKGTSMSSEMKKEIEELVSNHTGWTTEDAIEVLQYREKQRKDREKK